MKSNIIRRYRRKLRRVQLNFRRMNFTLIGDEGKPWRRAIAIAAGVLLLLVALIFGRAETQLMSSAEVKTVQERGVLRIGVIPDMPGAELEKELGRRIAAKLLPDADPESRIDFRDVTTMTAGANIDDGTVDMVIASQMSAKYTYSDSYYTEECILVVKTGTSAFALKSFTVGYIQSNRLRKTAEDITLGGYLAANSSLDIDKKSYASYPDMLAALDRGEIGGAVLPRQVFNELRTQYPITETTLVIGTIDYKVMCPGDSTVLSELATIVIRQMRDSGELAELYAQYG